MAEITDLRDSCHRPLCARSLTSCQASRLEKMAMVVRKAPRFLHRLAREVRNLFRCALNPSNRRSVVVCPRDQMPAAVVLQGTNRLAPCSRRDEQLPCGEECMPQLHYSADDLAGFLQRNEGKSCSRCGAPISAKDWYGSRLAGVGAEFRALAADMAGSSPQPICCNCLF